MIKAGSDITASKNGLFHFGFDSIMLCVMDLGLGLVTNSPWLLIIHFIDC